MFPDPHIRWKPVPTIIDGIGRPPYALNCGLHRDGLHLLVTHGDTDYGVTIPCEVYFGVEEMLHSVMPHGTGAAYDGSTYLKEAEGSTLVGSLEKHDPVQRRFRHYLFVGGDFCYETAGVDDPVIVKFESRQAADAWANKVVTQ
ncbi:hypothetical protein [Brevundimonas sp.]|uniref:hypothetical protein n=1 Tax=Brevundimonas sp. TaxID=1871086 RepID=UPI002731699C|nr:hypothetical protein [Brevundimonas sp.]